MSGEENGRAVQIGVLGGCLIEGDAEQKTRERKTKRRALTISILLQSMAIAAIVMVPLLGHTEKIIYKGVIPMPPYRPMANRQVPEVKPIATNKRVVCFDCFNHLSPRPVEVSRERIDPIPTAGEPGIEIGIPTEGIPGGNTLTHTPAPPVDTEKNKKRRISVGGDVQGAMLIRRVEPAFPPLARQLGRSGVVHIRAIISTEGSIESLQVLDGDPWFVQSAKDAVSQWHYRPTSLNGVPVEVETIITVVYSLNR